MTQTTYIPTEEEISAKMKQYAMVPEIQREYAIEYVIEDKIQDLKKKYSFIAGINVLKV